MSNFTYKPTQKNEAIALAKHFINEVINDLDKRRSATFITIDDIRGKLMEAEVKVVEALITE